MEFTKNNIFLNDEWFAAFTAVMAVTGALEAVLCFTSHSSEFVMVPFAAFLGVLLFLSYKRHEKNVMKGLIGAELMWMLYEEVSFCCLVVFEGKADFTASLGKLYPFFSSLKVVNVFAVLLIFLLHFRINAEHRSRPVEIRINQVLNFVMVLCYVLDILTQLFFGEITASQIVLMVFKIFLMLMVISIESRLDEYRIIKEKSRQPAEAS